MAVGGVGMVAANVEINARSPPANSNNAQGSGLFRVEEPGALQAVSRGIRGLQKRYQIAKFTFQGREGFAQRGDLPVAPVPAHAAQACRSAQEAASGKFFV